MLRLALGHSADIDLDRAAEEAIDQAQTELAGETAAAGLLFVSSGLDFSDALKRVRDAFPDLLLVGCSTAGEASSSLGFQDDSILLILFVSADVRFAAALGRDPSQDPETAVAEAVAQLRKQAGEEVPQLCFMLSDAIVSNPDLALRAIERHFGAPVPIIGGAAATYPPGDGAVVSIDDQVLSDAFVLLALHGPLEIATATETSWCPVGKAGVVTDAESNVIRSIDGIPALEFYRRALGADATVFLGAPLAILEADGSFRVRSPMTIDDESQAITVNGGVSKGDQVQLAFATVDDVHQGAGNVIERGLKRFPGVEEPAFVFFCSCASRRMFLALDTESELAQVRERLSQNVPVVGFYGYGEIGADSIEQSPKFHNQAIVLAAVR